MLFWVIAAVLTLGASLAVLLPLASSPRLDPDGSSHDLEVYRDQFSELERDVASGLIHPSQAEQARAEIGRRILRLADAGQTGKGDRASSFAVRMAMMAAVLVVPLVSWGVYARLGSPDLPSQPLGERLAKNPADSTIDELVARAEAHLAENPSDGRGWEVVAPIYLRMQRFADSVTAYRNAIRLGGESAERQAGLGEAIVNAGGGLVSTEAQSAFEAAMKLDPSNAKASFYLAMALAQEGRTDEAIAKWQAMLAALPEQSPWRRAVEEVLARAPGGAAGPGSPAAGPTKQEAEAAATMSDEDRSAMIETMVASLDEKLRQNPRDEDGWARLIRSYLVLGKTKEARDALDRGIATFGSQSEEARKLVAFAASLGLGAE